MCLSRLNQVGSVPSALVGTLQSRWAITGGRLLPICCFLCSLLMLCMNAQVRKIVPEDSTLCLDNGLYKVGCLPEQPKIA